MGWERDKDVPSVAFSCDMVIRCEEDDVKKESDWCYRISLLCSLWLCGLDSLAAISS